MTTADSTLLLADQTIWTADGYVTPLSGAAAITLADVAASAAGALLIAGQAAATLDDATLAAAGELPIRGEAAITLGDLVALGTAEKYVTIDLDRIIEIDRAYRWVAIGAASRNVAIGIASRTVH